MEVPLNEVYEVVELAYDERTPTPGALMSGFILLLPSIETGPRLLKLAIVPVPELKAPTVYEES
jgi:hypothetical protein